MELVIKIPKKTVNEIRDNAMFAGSIPSDILWDISRAIVNGTPLDKHDEEVIAETVESIWGKPPYRDMLDKIRAEIEELDRYYDNDYFSTNNRPMYACSDVLQIIDKYKAEKENE